MYKKRKSFAPETWKVSAFKTLFYNGTTSVLKKGCLAEK